MKTLPFYPKLVSLLALMFMCFTGKAQCPDIVAISPTHITLSYSSAFGNTITEVTITVASKGTAVFSGFKITNATNSFVEIPNLSDISSGTTSAIDSTDVNPIIVVTDGFTTRTCTTLTVLPVKLINFTISKFEDNIFLQWQTATENNSDYFEIQFFGKDGWVNVGNDVAAAGNSTSLNSYKFLLKYGEAGMYRLKCVDKDGKYDYSQVRSISFTNEKIKLYPNPVSSVLVIEGKYSSVTVTDVTGKILIINQNQNKVDLSKLDPGIYYIKIEDDSKVLVNQMVSKI